MKVYALLSCVDENSEGRLIGVYSSYELALEAGGEYRKHNPEDEYDHLLIEKRMMDEDYCIVAGDKFFSFFKQGDVLQ